MINLSFAASSPLTTTPSAAPMPALAPPAGSAGGGDFSRSLDRMQAPRPSPPPVSKVKIDSASDSPDAATTGPDTAAESKRALDALGTMQRTAAARQAALRNAAQAAESAKAGKARADGAPGGEKVLSAEPTVPPTDPAVAGPGVGPDCEFLPDAAPNDTGCIVLPPSVLPAEAPQSKRTLPAPLPDGDNPAGRPQRLPPIEVDGQYPRLTVQRPGQGTGQSIKADTPEYPPIRTDQSDPRGAPQPIRSKFDTPLPPAGTGEGETKNTAAAALAARPSLPPMPVEDGVMTTGRTTLPALLPATKLGATGDGTFTAAQGAAAALAAVMPTADSARNEATAAAQLQARPGSSEFAHELGAQVAVWAKDGVQRASLQLNPLELGPVSVQIKLDGSGAQVTLAADLAATRLALEQALPSLAGSLREAGLTLTGGGVFDQTRSQAGADGSNGNGGSGSRAESRRTSPAVEVERGDRVPMAAPRSRGVVDLMA